MSVTVHEHALGLTWVCRDALARACHALRAPDGRVWLVDPVDEPEALEAVAALGEVRGVVMLLDRHNRDCHALAERFGVEVLVVPRDLHGFEVARVLDTPLWKEIALWSQDHRALVVAEVVGTHPVWAAGPPAAGVHPFVRLRPPGGLERFDPELLLVGHGPPLTGPEAGQALRDGLARTRRDIPRLATKLPDVWRSGRR